jgi:hypothetical protein
MTRRPMTVCMVGSLRLVVDGCRDGPCHMGPWVPDCGKPHFGTNGSFPLCRVMTILIKAGVGFAPATERSHSAPSCFSMTDLYNILQVQRDAEPEVIRAAHRALARKHHPDFGGNPKRMAAINLAWSILGNPARRARYDAGPGLAAVAPATNAAPTPQPTYHVETQVSGDEPPTPPGSGAPRRTLSEQRGGGTVLDFGRYAGWNVGTLADQDPNYLRWLSRTPIGRRLTAEIDAALSLRAAELSALHPDPFIPQRRGLFASLGTIRTAAR